jgi:hypothetical protein
LKPPPRTTAEAPGVVEEYDVKVPPTSVPAVEQRAEEVADMRIQARRYGAQLTTNPYEALLEEVSRTAGHVAWLGVKVSQAETDDALLVAPYANWLALYRAERKQLIAVSESAIRMGIAEREVRLAEKQGELLVWVIGRVVQDLELSAEAQDRVPELVRRYALEARALEAEG